MRVLLAAFAVALACAGSAAAAVPTLILYHGSPVTVAGRGFEPSARVTVTIDLGGNSFSKIVRASARGVFAARWNAAFTLGGCRPVVVTAVSAHRSARTTALPNGLKHCGALRVGPVAAPIVRPVVPAP